MHAIRHDVRFACLGGALFLLLGTTACKDVQKTDVIGTWIMIYSSRQVLPNELQKAAPRIVLSPDGTFSAFELPGFFYFPGRYAARLESGSGDWKLLSREGEQQVQLTFRTIVDWDSEELPYGSQLDISSGWSGIELYYFLGGEDEGKEIDFVKR